MLRNLEIDRYEIRKYFFRNGVLSLLLIKMMSMTVGVIGGDVLAKIGTTDILDFIENVSNSD